MKSPVQLIYTLLFSILCALIPFTEQLQAIPNILLAILGLIFLLNLNKKDFKSVEISHWLYIGLCGFVFLGILINQRFGDLSFAFRLLLPVALVILSFPLKDKKKPLYFFLGGSLGMLLISVINLVIHYIKFNSLKIDVGDEVNSLLLGERPYLGFIYLTSMLVCIYLQKSELNKTRRTGLLILAAIFAGFIIFISARLSILSLLLILSISVFYSKNKIKTLFGSLGAGLIIVLVLVFSPNFVKRLTAGFEIDATKFENVLQLEPRYHIWECSAQIIKDNGSPVLGFGFRNTIDYLADCYAHRDKFQNEEHQAYFVNSRFNTHNQFLNFLMSSGWLSFLIFAAFFFLMLFKNHKSYLPFAMVSALFLFCIFENILSRQLGAMLFGLIIVFVGLINSEKK